MNSNSQLLESLATSQTYKDYEKAYNEATGLPVSLRPVETWQLPLHGRRNESGFCAMMARKSRTCAACLLVQEKLCQDARQGAAMATCRFGLTEAAVPVRLGQEPIGFLQTGQVFERKPTEAQFEKAAKELEEMGLKLPRTELREAFFNTPVVSRRKLDAVTHLLNVFGEHLSLLSNQIAVQRSNAEPPVITKARQYIHEHQGESLSLGQVAKAVNTSTFYFCKLFKKVTGVNFTEYVSRVRVERARELLLNPNLRVSEIAYEVGFQSLTHFNRVFRKLLGQSPTEYREHLPATAGN
jgi:AraC-like DNA-binding protein/ligand-binding sensor protein